MQQENPKSYYAEGWNLACTWYAPGSVNRFDLASLFNQHCQNIGVTPFGVPCPDETARAFSGFVAGCHYLDENMHFQRTRHWQLSTAALSNCVEKASQIYYYTTQEDQGNHDWRVYAPRLVNNTTVDEFGLTLPLFSDWIKQQQKHNPHAQVLCIMEHDPSWVGSRVRVDEKTELWVFANIYVCGSEPAAADYNGGAEPIARVYRYDFPEETEGEDDGAHDMRERAMSLQGMNITGEQPTPERGQVIREAAHAAAVYGYYDTSELAQRDGSLIITMLDATTLDELPEGAISRFYVFINQTAYMVTRYADRYAVEVDTRTEGHRQEHELRQAVLDTALWYFTGAESSNYQPGASDEERARVISELLADGAEDEDAVPIDRPVVSEEQPDLYLAGADGGESSLVQRQWSVSVGWYACQIGLITKKDGSPELVAVDLSDDPEDEYVLAGLALREDLARLEQGLPAMLKYPSHLEEAQNTIYGTVLTLLLDRGVPKELADPTRAFLATFHQRLEHRQRVTTWEYNGKWFAARVVQAATADQAEQTADAMGPADTEGQALEMLYELYPELR